PELEAAGPVDSPAAAPATTRELQLTVSTDEHFTPRTGEFAAAPTASRAARLISKIKRHQVKAATVALGTLLLLAAVGIGLYKWLVPGAPRSSLSLANLRFARITTVGRESAMAISPDG